MAAYDDLVAKFNRADAATTAIAGDITRLKDQIAAGMTEAQVADLQEKFETAAARLEALDAENPEGTVPA
jgi:hypothetical protein